MTSDVRCGRSVMHYYTFVPATIKNTKQSYCQQSCEVLDGSITPLKCFYWYKKGTQISHNIYHREDGPAVMRPDGSVEYWYQGEKLNSSNDEEFFRLLKLKAFW